MLVISRGQRPPPVATLATHLQRDRRQCVVNRGDLHVELSSLDHIGGSDNGANIEFYGVVGVRYPVEGSDVVDCQTGGEVAYLFQLEDGQWLTMTEFSSWTPSSSTYVDLEMIPVAPEQKICLFTELWEEDSDNWELSGDDYFGRHERLMSFDSWAGEHVLQPRGDGQNAVDVHVRIRLE